MIYGPTLLLINLIYAQVIKESVAVPRIGSTVEEVVTSLTQRSKGRGQRCVTSRRSLLFILVSLLCLLSPHSAASLGALIYPPDTTLYINQHNTTSPNSGDLPKISTIHQSHIQPLFPFLTNYTLHKCIKQNILNQGRRQLGTGIF